MYVIYYSEHLLRTSLEKERIEQKYIRSHVIKIINDIHSSIVTENIEAKSIES